MMCSALTSSSSKMPSNRFQMGFQYTPVDSMATWLTSSSVSQSARASRELVSVR